MVKTFGLSWTKSIYVVAVMNIHLHTLIFLFINGKKSKHSALVGPSRLLYIVILLYVFVDVLKRLLNLKSKLLE